ncbi:DUF362 domain-containing protein [Lujinxingia sediminis]|uniref:DUF362 domain-containing protein n=1 Tax=Lujinxingia sediminis TaxID=2480984 RepID=A0ABY0CQM7_9DELT|nr:DUF362 domain-containing protein [Lujinxingia sediminis]RVU42444.1 DUF362 domain-containing protein [Lujinxingia sediminis]
MDRRNFLKHLAGLSALAASGAWLGCATPTTAASRRLPLQVGASTESPTLARTPVALIAATDRRQATEEALALLDITLRGKRVFVQPTLHSAQPPPYSTHTHILATLARHARSRECTDLVVATRHPHHSTAALFRAKQLPTMARELGFDLLALDELPSHQWRHVRPEHSAWEQGFALPRQVMDADVYLQLTTALSEAEPPHLRMALHGARGLLGVRIPGSEHNLDEELTGCDDPIPRQLELVEARTPDLILLDAIDVAASESSGERCGVFVAGLDPLAVDAVGLALLRRYQPAKATAEHAIFEHPLLQAAASRGSLIASAREIEFLTDKASAPLAEELRARLGV